LYQKRWGVLAISALFSLLVLVSPNENLAYAGGPDEETCECERPTIFTVLYNGPGIAGGIGGDEPVTIEIYKKEKDVGKPDKLLVPPIPGVIDGDMIVLDSADFGRDEVHSSTVYHVKQGEESIATISIHTSCSKPLFIGDMHSDGDVTLTVVSGVDDQGEQSIFFEDDLTCTLDFPIVCDEGFELVGNECVPIVCDEGFELVGNEVWIEIVAIDSSPCFTW